MGGPANVDLDDPRCGVGKGNKPSWAAVNAPHRIAATTTTEPRGGPDGLAGPATRTRAASTRDTDLRSTLHAMTAISPTTTFPLDRAADGFREALEKHGRYSIYAIASGRAPNEAAYTVQKWIRSGFGTNLVDNCSRA